MKTDKLMSIKNGLSGTKSTNDYHHGIPVILDKTSGIKIDI